MLIPLFAGPRHEEQAAFRYADLILPLNLPQLLTYGIPHEMQGSIRAGMRVEVSLGRNKQYAAIVSRLHNEAPDAYSVKPIRAIIDAEPVVNSRQLQFWNWIIQYYVAAPGAVMQAALPAHLKLSGETRIQWMPGLDMPQHEWSSDETFMAAEALELRRELTMTELRAIVGQRALSAVLRELLEQECVLINDALEPSYRPRRERIVRLTEAYSGDGMARLFDELKRAPRQLDVLMAYVELSMKQGFVRQHDLLERSGATAAQVRALADKGIFIIEDRDTDRLRYEGDGTVKEIAFTPAQQQAYETLEAGLEQKDVVLLQGVTGSGKTLLYIHKIKACLAEGKQAILLLPEIGLTTQLVSRLYAYFGAELGVYHSRFSNNERVEIWEKVQRGDYKVVVGPRSALWLPYDNLGLIIVDEEHDGSYKQKDPAPRFHARDAAIYLASLHGARVILGSATPSVESFYNVRLGKYAYAELKERYMGVGMPAIRIISPRPPEQAQRQASHLLSPDLQSAITDTLARNKQVILFQNRRGYAPFQMCTVCGWVPQCRNCAVSLTYHKSTDKLHCHYCGLSVAVVHACAKCGSNRIISRSFGTEKIEEEVRQIFPKARVARMDVDSMRGRQSMSLLLEQLEKRRIDILVGTQMVVKGLDFASVALVGVLSADSLLSYPDFRVNERAFQLMEQVSGRAGRADGEGLVLIQAYNLQHPVLGWVQDHNVAAFLEHEIRYRELFAYPPFTRLIKVMIKHPEEARAMESGMELAESMQSIQGIQIQGPVPALVARVRNMYVQEVWIKCPRDLKLLEQVKKLLLSQQQAITGRRGNHKLVMTLDIDPV